MATVQNQNLEQEPASFMMIDTFELNAVDIHSVPLDYLHALSVSVHWPHRAADWRFYLEHGQGIAALDEIGRIVGSAMWFPYSNDFAMIGMLITSPRLQAHGAGRWLMSRVMAATDQRALALNATKAAYRLYRSIGFVDQPTIFHMEGEARSTKNIPALASGEILRPMTINDIPALIEIDTSAFGVKREILLSKLFERSKGMVLTRNDKVVAGSLCRQFGRGYSIAPLIAANDHDAICVTMPHIQDHSGSILRVDTPCKSGIFRDYLEQFGLKICDTVTAMSLGVNHTRWPNSATSGLPMLYGLANQSLG